MAKSTWAPRFDVNECFSELRRDWQIWRECSDSSVVSTREIVSENRRVIRTNPYGPIFWMMLAYLQHADGCLQPLVLERATAAIGRGAAKIEWFDRSLSVAQRNADMDRLRELLRSPMPKPKPFGVTPIEPTGARLGDVMQVSIARGIRAVLKVVRLVWIGRERAPLCVVIPWTRKRFPTAIELANEVPFLRLLDQGKADLAWRVKDSKAPFSPVAIRGLRDRWDERSGVRIKKSETLFTVLDGWGGHRFSNGTHFHKTSRIFFARRVTFPLLRAGMMDERPNLPCSHTATDTTHAAPRTESFSISSSNQDFTQSST